MRDLKFLRSQDTNYPEKIFFFFPKVTCEESEVLVLFLIKPLPYQFGEHP